MANKGLPVQSVVNVTVIMAPKAASERNFGVALILGASNVIDTNERLRLYYDIDSVASDFGTDAPEYKMAVAYFSADPSPAQCYIGRWAKTATTGLIKGKILGTAEQNIETFKAINAGDFTVKIDGKKKTLSGIDLTAVTNLNGVATQIQTALGADGVSLWDGTRFVIASSTTGEQSSVLEVSDTPLTKIMGLAADTTSIAGRDTEKLVEAVTLLADISSDWYGLLVAEEAGDDDIIEAADFIAATSTSRIAGFTAKDTRALDQTTESDLPSRLKAKGNNRTFVQYCSASNAAAAAAFGRGFTVNFNGQNTTITLKFKQEPGIEPEVLTATQAKALRDKNCNVFTQYSNDTAILQEGVMSGGWFFDERHGLDWLQNTVQTAVWNLLYTSTSKIPQTDAGMNRIITTIESRLEQGRVNGLIAPGVWNGDSFGALMTGDTLTKGYYVYAPPVSSQSQANREARESTVIQVAIKLAGAVHATDIIINVNR